MRFKTEISLYYFPDRRKLTVILLLIMKLKALLVSQGGYEFYKLQNDPHFPFIRKTLATFGNEA